MAASSSSPKSKSTAEVRPEHIVWLASEKILLRNPGTGQPISLTLEGDRTYLAITALRAFPQESPNAYIQIFHAKRYGERAEMIGMIQSLPALSPQNRTALEEALRRSYLVPKVLAILHLEESRYRSRWTVQTDRGERAFDMHQPHRNVVLTSKGRVIMTDVEENRYEIANLEELDESSRTLLERIL